MLRSNGTPIVKRRGHTEPFESRKLYASVFAACRNAHLAEAEAEKFAGIVADEISAWVAHQETVTSEQIFREAAAALRRLHTDAGFLYETHRDIA
jgi:transcriptional regulator NrdR family protein